MKTIHLRQKSDLDGKLHLDLPVGTPEVECDVTIVVGPNNTPITWLPDFWDEVSKGWQGEPLMRPPQGAVERREPIR